MCAGGQSFCAADKGKATAIAARRLCLESGKADRWRPSSIAPLGARIDTPDGDLCGVINQHGNPTKPRPTFQLHAHCKYIRYLAQK